MGYNIYSSPVTDAKAWLSLENKKPQICQESGHLKNLTTEKDRITGFSISTPGLFYDFSRQRINKSIMDSLIDLAKEREVRPFFKKMSNGEIVNTTENLPAEHIAIRANFCDLPNTDEARLSSKARGDLLKAISFSKEIRNGSRKSSTGEIFTDVVVIGIGGSHLGTAFVASALKDFSDREIRLHFLSNVDYSGFADITEIIHPSTTLWIVISKSFTTSEVACNAWIAWNYMAESVPDPSMHFVAISASEKAAQSTSPKFSCVFSMPEGVGGRYSVTSTAGILPLSIYIGFENVSKLLKGAHEMDIHASESPEEKNMPLIAALIGLWNNCFLKYPAQGIIPYSNRLSLLHSHIQQLYMESCGKSVTGNGKNLDIPSGVIIIGDTGTNAQHSFFQLMHQGRPFPVEFIGIAKPLHEQKIKGLFGIPNHHELWINMIAQAEALACGRESDDPAKRCPGNRPSSIIVLDSITPEDIGKLLSFYEAKTVYEAFLSGYNPFDQFGVETGKIIASGLRQKIVSNDKCRDEVRGITAFYLDKIVSN
ncbi:glucose-6-phosphate isomerase [Desulforegula conservatrix]|uniref:glucose-6-phosphate isomerase n=1 Tax=Desulforegula conservatrix TaxID=153026 RepID=UPI0004002DD8|nr:glucose-6-phosphate isomerase [Desulforegula conservatrix]